MLAEICPSMAPTKFEIQRGDQDHDEGDRCAFVRPEQQCQTGPGGSATTCASALHRAIKSGDD